MRTKDRQGGKPAPSSGTPEPKFDASFDVIVIGAGINGAGTAWDAAARGLRVALIEREDIGSGTSNYSGRLVHGGLRYLEQGDVRLVRESLRERERLFRSAPHLVKPVSLMMPFYETNKRSKWFVRAGMIAYDVLSFDKSTVSHHVLSREETLKRSPGIDPDGLQGSAIFMDGQVVWSERLCTEIVLAASAAGAKVYTHAAVDGLVSDDNTVRGVRYTDRLTGERHALVARLVVNAAGPWVDHVLASGGRTNERFIGGTKGSHAIVGPFPGAPRDVVYYESKQDGRLVLVIPWGEHFMLGTTDRRFEGDPEEARADADEVDYLLGEVNRLIPGAKLTPADVLFTYSGVRPLPFNPGKAEWNVPRSHVIKDHAPVQKGLLSLIGGKLTTYRSLAEDATDEIFKQLGRKPPKCATETGPFVGARVADWDAFRAELAATGLAKPTVDRLVDLYGSRAGDIVALGRTEPELLKPLDTVTGVIGAELVFTFKNEFCRTLSDVLVRRTMVSHSAGNGLGVVDRAADILAAHLGWDRDRRDREVADYRRHVKRFAVPDASPPAKPTTAADLNASAA